MMHPIPKHPLWPTILLLAGGAMLGGILAVFIGLLIAITGAAMGGAAAILVMAPLLLGTAGLAVIIILVVLPVWAIVGGALFASAAGGKSGSIVRSMAVKFLPENHPLFEYVQWEAKRLGIQRIPYVGWYDSEEINAFAIGTTPQSTAIVLSGGAAVNVPVEEVKAIVCHELGHVASNDMARMTYAYGVREALTFFLAFRGLKGTARWVFTPLSELVLQRFSRKREFTADAISARLTSPDAVLAILRRLQAEDESEQRNGFAPFMMTSAFDLPWLSSHPPLADRIAAIETLKRGARYWASLSEARVWSDQA